MKFRFRRGLDPMLAMINVVFLLLAFFMLGQFESTRPKDFQMPRASIYESAMATHIYVDKEASLIALNYQDKDVIDYAKTKDGVVVSADALLEANRLLEILAMLKEEGVQIVGVEVEVGE